MSNHPNRKKEIRGIPPSSPTPEQVREMRLAAGLTQTEAAALVYTSLRSCQMWESGDRTMPAAAWELFLLKLARRGVDLPPIFKRIVDSLYPLPSDVSPATKR